MTPDPIHVAVRDARTCVAGPLPELMSDAKQTVAWLHEFAVAVRAADYERGRGMFAPEAVGFGTVAERAVGLQTLIDAQWRRVWSATRDFTFDLDTVEYGGAEPIYWVAVRWSSFGDDGAGGNIQRRGRATIVLHRRDGKLLAVHSHFSFVPSGDVTPQQARRQ